jgi:hypothetical protein
MGISSRSEVPADRYSRYEVLADRSSRSEVPTNRSNANLGIQQTYLGRSGRGFLQLRAKVARFAVICIFSQWAIFPVREPL